MSSRLRAVDIRVDLSALPDNEKQALVRIIIQAARLLDGLFMQQISASNLSPPLAAAARDDLSGQGAPRQFPDQQGAVLRRSTITSRSCPAWRPKTPQGNFYPADATRAKGGCLDEDPAGRREGGATGFFTTIRRDAKWQAHRGPPTRTNTRAS